MYDYSIKIFDVTIQKISEQSILKIAQDFISSNRKGTICYVNVNSLNIAYNNNKLKSYLSTFDTLHPDGIGVFLASKLLYGKNGLAKRITGSDFYVELIQESLKNHWSFFFFGDTDKTLNKISKYNSGLIIKGFCNGFNYNNDELIKYINTSKPDILIVGLGSPKQEEWVVTNKDNINAQVIIAVGDGIKVFAGNKKRGPKILQKLGLEWFIRFLYEPKRLWKRYFIGIPLFIFRVIRYKFSSEFKG